MKQVDLMLDLETFSTDSNACIIQISAVPFCLNSGELDYGPFNYLINPMTSVNNGGKINGETVEWWLKQEKSVVTKVFVTAIDAGFDIKDVLKSFSEYVEALKKHFNVKTVQLWGNGIAADNVWLANAYKGAGIKHPVTFRDDMDVRTLVRIGREFDIDLKDAIKFVGEKHNAIDDCRHQIKYLVAIFNEIRGKMAVVSSKQPSES